MLGDAKCKMLKFGTAQGTQGLADHWARNVIYEAKPNTWHRRARSAYNPSQPNSVFSE